MAFAQKCIHRRRERWAALSLLCSCLWGLTAGHIRYSIPEEQQHGTFVGNVVKDLSLDMQRMAARRMKLSTAGRKQYLDLNPDSGSLFVNERIDRESLCELRASCFLNMEVIMENPLEAFNVEVEILDVNDNAPVFPRNEYHLEITESALPGARFPVEGAQDLDVGTNGIRTYMLSPNEHFVLDSSGPAVNSKLIELVLKKSLDRELNSLHQLLLTAVDGGIPTKTGTAKITVLVLDSNDNAPVFDKQVYKVQLVEDAPPGTLVIKLNATDLDEGPNGEVMYSFSGYTPDNVRQLFGMNPSTGEIRVRSPLDYEQASSYEIYVQAMDKGASAVAVHCKVVVEIIDVNDHIPEIIVSSLTSPVREDARPDTIVALISVEDKDSGVNKQVSLNIPSDLPFSIKSSKNYYKLVTDRLLDREKVAAYNITFTATDSGSPPLSSQKTVHVEVSDVNDNSPQFEKNSYAVYINENNAPGASLHSVKAIDPDINENAFVSYSIVNHNVNEMPVTSYVSINSETGVVYALRSFDYETLREFNFEVKAQDAGIPPLTSMAVVNIYVVDQNDNPPYFLHPPAANFSTSTETVPKTADVGYLVTKVLAIDADAGKNAWLFYSLLQATDASLFKLNQHTGEIRTTRKIGEENSTSFSIIILVKDNGSPSLSATATVNVAVVDRSAKVVPESKGTINNIKDSIISKFNIQSDMTLYLIIALSAVSFVFLLTIIILAAIRCHKCSGTCCSSPCCADERHAAEMYKQANNNIAQRDLKVQPHFIEVRGNGSLSKTYCYKACLTAGSGSDMFMFYNTGCPPGAGPSASTSERCLTVQSRQSQQSQNSTINRKSLPCEPKQPNTDWRYSASLRAGMQSSVHMEESAVLQGPSGVHIQNWPTVSSATPEPEAGEVSPPVGAGINSNSWTFKYGPPAGNPQQLKPGEVPENFIIPGSPAIISIRQGPPGAADDKSDFITFGKKEETKKKKKKKKGKADKKEKSNDGGDH
ncbi:protocadherin alpha-C2-like isoform X20 [Erpetoichthys calabaricus]|uniref:protocadherin alpha-C2-like isoform X20 n=1 Tax=Erpetoichthys calabaricus TaxID=27687 RepID=UPI0022340210|nr:protocadherin alpha-C2-like isoform X20 [Erpetoichthys calabaricus]